MSGKFRPTQKKGPGQRSKQRQKKQVPADVYMAVKTARLGKFAKRLGG